MTHRNYRNCKLGVDADNQIRARNDVRRAVANLAARLIFEGLSDFRAAKLKAAERLGATNRYSLPDDHEVESALREYHILFAAETQPRALVALRKSALRLLSWLEQFSPWLIGPLLSGAANEYTEIELELIGVNAKEFELFLINSQMKFALGKLQKPDTTTSRYSSRQAYRFDFEGAAVSVTLHGSHSLRMSWHPAGSLRHDRVQLKEAARRFSASPDATLLAHTSDHPQSCS